MATPSDRIIYVLADIIFEWRGPKYYPWVGEEAIVNNLDQMSTGIALITMIVLALGYWKDRRTLRGEYWGDHRNIIVHERCNCSVVFRIVFRTPQETIAGDYCKSDQADKRRDQEPFGTRFFWICSGVMQALHAAHFCQDT
jgi:hypothetical protein